MPIIFVLPCQLESVRINEEKVGAGQFGFASDVPKEPCHGKNHHNISPNWKFYNIPSVFLHPHPVPPFPRINFQSESKHRVHHTKTGCSDISHINEISPKGYTRFSEFEFEFAWVIQSPLRLLFPLRPSWGSHDPNPNPNPNPQNPSSRKARRASERDRFGLLWRRRGSTPHGRTLVSHRGTAPHGWRRQWSHCPCRPRGRLRRSSTGSAPCSGRGSCGRPSVRTHRRRLPPARSSASTRSSSRILPSTRSQSSPSSPSSPGIIPSSRRGSPTPSVRGFWRSVF